MKKLTLYSLLLTSLLSLNSVQAASSALVINGNDSGVGSLRAALESGANTIRISSSVAFITLSEPLSYDGERRLFIKGTGQVIDASALQDTADILSINDGANLQISNLDFIGNSSSINQDPLNPIGGKGIFVNVPETRQGLVRVVLNGVSVSNVGNHGVHVSDCTLRDECGGGSGGGGQGSPASVFVKLNNVMINRVGFGRQDADGVRVDERGDGDIFFYANDSKFLNVGADGVELDEGNNGNVISNVNNSQFDRNGEYCLAIPFVANGPCDDDGAPDADDGFDIDEAGEGSLFAQVSNTVVTNNFDEGLDFDEKDAGHVYARINKTVALNNADEGIKVSEEGEGNLVASLRRISISNNNDGDEGIELEEANAGDVRVRVVKSTLIGSDEALKVEQDDEGEGILIIRDSNIDVLDLEGINQN